jgi:peptidoglycan DL-endopeptidase LytE
MTLNKERRKFMIGRCTFLGMGIVVLSMLVGFHAKGLAEERYIVKPGDSLYKISKSFGLSTEALKRANGLKEEGIKPKQVLLIPTRDEKQTRATVKRPPVETESYVVRKGDSLYSISKKVDLSVEEVKRMNRLHSVSLKAGQVIHLPKTGLRDEVEEAEELGGSDESTGARLAEGSVEKQEVAEPLGKWSNPEERNLLIRVAKTFLGAPYRLGGSTLKGIDCSAFVKKIYEIFNTPLPRTAREQSQIGKKVDKEALEEGDLVFFKTRRSNNGHVGIYIGNNEFVHASRFNKEVKVDNLDTPYFSKRFLKGVRVKELEQES